MRTVLVIVLLIGLLVAVGWVSFHYNGRQASMSLNTQRVQEDTRKLIHEGEEAVRTAKERGKEWTKESSESEEPAEEATRP